MDRTSWYGDGFYVADFGQVTLKWPPKFRQAPSPEGRVFFELSLKDDAALTLVRRALSAHKRVIRPSSSFREMSFAVSTANVATEEQGNFLRNVTEDVMSLIHDAARQMAVFHIPQARIFASSRR